MMISFSDIILFANSNHVAENFGDWVDFLNERDFILSDNDLWNKLKLPEFDYDTLANSLQAFIISELEEVFEGVSDFDYQINGLATSLTIGGIYNPDKADLINLYDKIIWARNYYEPST